MVESTDVWLVERFLSENDALAYSQLVERHYATVYGYACSLVGDWMEAQDLTQEAFLKAQFQLHTLRDSHRFGPWVKRILYTLYIDWKRRFHPESYRYLESSETPLEERVNNGEENPLERLLRSEILEEIRAATEQLSPHYRLPFTLYHLDALGYKAIAEVLDLPLNTVKSLLRRARKKVQTELLPYLRETPQWTQISLDFHSLPSRQGWIYYSGYETLLGGPPEERVCSLRSGALIVDNADLFPDNVASYKLCGVVNPVRPFALTLRLRLLRETARYPEFEVPGERCQGERVRGTSFGIKVCTGAEIFKIGIGQKQIATVSGTLVTTGLDHRQFHDYRLEGIPGSGSQLFVDGRLVVSDLPMRGTHRNQLAFGDLSPTSGNVHAEITALCFNQVQSSAAGDSEIGKKRPFAGLGGWEEEMPFLVGERAAWVERDLRAVIMRHSRKWRLGPGGRIEPVDFAD